MTDKIDFLKNVVPFDLLPDDILQGVAELLEEVKHGRDATIYHQDDSKLKGLDIIVKGQFETFFLDSERNKRMPEILKAGSLYGGVSLLLNRKRSIRTVVAQKGTLVYFLPRAHFKELCRANEAFFHYFTTEYGKRMLNDEFAHFVKNSLPGSENYIISDQFFSRTIETINLKRISTCSADMPIFEVARVMSRQKVGCLFITNKHDELIGYVTDMTLRDNIIANRINLDEPIENYVDNPIVSISEKAFVYEALLLMFRTKTRYILIKQGEEIKGMLSRNKLLTDQAQSPFVFIQAVKLSTSVSELKRRWEKVPLIVFQLLDRGVKAEIVNQVISSISDTITQNVIESLIAEMGPPPARFAFMVLGSEGRKEQTLKTDQDNAIIYEDKANEQRELVREYFLKFAEGVSERLDQIGFSFCTGGFMAKNPKWTHSLSHWKNNYKQWIERPIPESVMKFSTFFDCRHIYGERNLVDSLKEYIGEKLKEPNEMFFYNLGINALQYEPPLTFFKNFRTFARGEHNVFDLKKTMTPIVDAIRVYALKNKIFKTNTGERIHELYAKKVFDEKEFMEILQAYYYLMAMRLKRQAENIIKDRNEPHNYLNPSTLTKIEQVTLKEIFKVIENFQLKIKIDFTKSLR